MISQIATTTTTMPGEGVRGRDTSERKIIGKVANRRVKFADGQIELPDTPEGRALRLLLAGIRGGPITLDVIDWRREFIQGLRDLLNAILALLDPTEDRAAVRDRLIKIGVGTAATLALDEWVTLDRVNRWWNELIWNPAYTWATCLQSVLVARLKAHVEPPESPASGPDDGWAYVTGKYADEIEY